MKHIESEEKFNEIIQSDKPVIIKFYADWCPDCKRLDAFINGVIKEFNNHEWYEINSDEVKGIAEKYEVKRITSIVIFIYEENKTTQHSAYSNTHETVNE